MAKQEALPTVQKENRGREHLEGREFVAGVDPVLRGSFGSPSIQSSLRL